MFFVSCQLCDVWGLCFKINRYTYLGKHEKTYNFCIIFNKCLTDEWSLKDPYLDRVQLNRAYLIMWLHFVYYYSNNYVDGDNIFWYVYISLFLLYKSVWCGQTHNSLVVTRYFSYWYILICFIFLRRHFLLIVINATARIGFNKISCMYVTSRYLVWCYPYSIVCFLYIIIMIIISNSSFVVVLPAV